MKNLIIIFLLLSSVLGFSQGNNKCKNPLKNSQNTEENKQEVGGAFIYKSFLLLGLDTEAARLNLQTDLNQNLNFKKAEIMENNQFSGFVKQEYLSSLKGYFKERGLTVKIHKSLSLDEGGSRVVIPENMKPIYVDTGDPIGDEERYTEAKKQLLIEHPEYIQE